MLIPEAIRCSAVENIPDRKNNESSGENSSRAELVSSGIVELSDLKLVISLLFAALKVFLVMLSPWSELSQHSQKK